MLLIKAAGLPIYFAVFPCKVFELRRSLLFLSGWLMTTEAQKERDSFTIEGSASCVENQKFSSLFVPITKR